MKYGAILADPPWTFKTYSEKGKGRSPDRHYDCSSMRDLERMSYLVDDFASEDCTLFMWVTDPMLKNGLALMERWGFEYKTIAFTWVKKTKVECVSDWVGFSVGMGYWTRSNPEICLLGTRGKPKRVNADVRQLIIAPRREHSRKPDEIYERIERLVDGPYLEMFARQRRPGWDAWGNEVDKFGAAR